MNTITKELLGLVSDLFDKPNGAYNIREDSGCAGRQSTENIEIKSKLGKPISPPASPTAMWMIWSTTISM